MFGAKLSWCQIVRCQIVLVPNCPGAKLSGAKLSYYQLKPYESEGKAEGARTLEIKLKRDETKQSKVFL